MNDREKREFYELFKSMMESSATIEGYELMVSRRRCIRFIDRAGRILFQTYEDALIERKDVLGPLFDEMVNRIKWPEDKMPQFNTLSYNNLPEKVREEVYDLMRPLFEWVPRIF